MLALELLGTPWSSEEPVPVRRGLALVDGVPSEEGEGDFAVVPVDARVGEWSVKQPPGLEDPVIYRGPSIGEVELGTEEWKRLEALGYIQ